MHHRREQSPPTQPPAQATVGERATVAGELVGPIHAFRDWRVTENGLTSPGTGAVWTGTVMRAECRPQTPEDFARPAHVAPGVGCTCGIHAYHEFSDARSKVDWRGVSGIVAVWGQIEVSSTGVRAEYASVEALGVYARWTSRQKAVVAALASDFGIEIVDLYDLSDAAVGLGGLVPVELRPGRSDGGRRSADGSRAGDERRIVVAPVADQCSAAPLAPRFEADLDQSS